MKRFSMLLMLLWLALAIAGCSTGESGDVAITDVMYNVEIEMVDMDSGTAVVSITIPDLLQEGSQTENDEQHSKKLTATVSVEKCDGIWVVSSTEEIENIIIEALNEDLYTLLEESGGVVLEYDEEVPAE